MYQDIIFQRLGAVLVQHATQVMHMNLIFGYMVMLGYYSDSTGASSCTSQCAAGSYSTGGASSCTSCVGGILLNIIHSLNVCLK